MGINLSRLDDGEEWTCNNSLWNFILDTALANSWSPLGTFKIDPESENEDTTWDKSDYRTQKGQQVIEEDVENLVKSLTNYLKADKSNNIENLTIKDFIKFVKPDDYCFGFEIY